MELKPGSHTRLGRTGRVKLEPGAINNFRLELKLLVSSLVDIFGV